ncbi:MAG: hypothetical protein NTX68_00115 [Rhodococcus sp.]|jgi:hypothetical protein|nr:hypothetical protein [Rhodococcus sp. (in: high G+C Gram-positive bacteria)]
MATSDRHARSATENPLDILSRISHPYLEPLRRVSTEPGAIGVIHIPMPSTAKRHRDRKKSSLFVEIDPAVVDRVTAEAAKRGVNKWEIVEAALGLGLERLTPVKEPYSLDLHGLDKTA